MLPDAERGKLAKVLATRVLRLTNHRDFELGKTRIFLRRGTTSKQARTHARRTTTSLTYLTPLFSLP